MVETKILFSNDWFDVVEVNYENCMMSGLKPKRAAVIILPYTKNEGKIENLGVNLEMNPLWSTDLKMTAITGGVEKDEQPFSAAKRELIEETGFNVEDDKKWDFLGMLRPSKVVKSEMFVYSVDVTGLEKNEKTGDGTENEKRSEFKMVTPAIAARSDDSLLMALMMKYFIFNYSE